MNILWVKIRSWHVLHQDRPVTYCGRRPPSTSEVVDTLPGERSCESCLRILARGVDR